MSRFFFNFREHVGEKIMCTGFTCIYQSYIKLIRLAVKRFFFYSIWLFRFKMKDRIAGPRCVPTGSVRSSRFLLPVVHLSLRTRFPSPPPSCPPLPTTCGLYSPALLAQRTNVSSRWTLRPIAEQVVSPTTSSSQRRGFKEMWTAPRLRRFGDLRPAGRSLGMNRRSYALLYVLRGARFVSRCVKAHEFARRTIAPAAVRLGILCPTD